MTKRGFIVKMSAGFLVLLFVGAFSVANAALESDPIELMEFSTFLGGTGDDDCDVSYEFGSTVVDSKGNIIVVDRTQSTDFPVKDAFQENYTDAGDGTISKFHPNGSLIFSTYLGGSEQEYITDVAIDSEDNIIVAGITGSPDFPVVNAFKSNSTGISPGNVDGFIAKLSEDGQSLLFSTYFGGSGNDWLYTMNIDSNDRIAFSGTTDSTDFPLLNPHQIANAGGREVFLVTLEADAQSIVFSTYLGTVENDHGRRVGFDSNGDVFVAGMSGTGDLATEGVYQEAHGGGNTDAFLAKYNINGTQEFFTFLGGEDSEWGVDLAIDSDDNVVVTGFTTSDDFPTTNPYQDERGGYADMFITKLSPDGQSAVFSTYLGGSSPDYGNAIIVDPQDRIIVTGQTKSTDFPTTLPFNSTDSMHYNVSLAVMSPEGSLLVSMSLGGEGDDVGIGVAWHSVDRYVVWGYANSADFPIVEAYQGTYAGNGDMFVMMLDL
ncbi:MAG: SBBP repeat-containing protein, partial [Candidatus Thorarchaeota archaeon]